MYTINLVKKEHMKGNDYIFDGDKQIREIQENGKTIAYIKFELEQDDMFIHMFEVIEKEQGYGTKIVKWLMDYYDLSAMKGFCISEERAYYFWLSLGAEISLMEEDMLEVDDMVKEGLESSFYLPV